MNGGLAANAALAGRQPAWERWIQLSLSFVLPLLLHVPPFLLPSFLHAAYVGFARTLGIQKCGREVGENEVQRYSPYKEEARV